MSANPFDQVQSEYAMLVFRFPCYFHLLDITMCTTLSLNQLRHANKKPGKLRDALKDILRGQKNRVFLLEPLFYVILDCKKNVWFR